MEKHAVYSGTRNLYGDMMTAAKSLVANSGVTDIWLLTEDDEFPHELPKGVNWHVLNMSDQQWFPANSINMTSVFTYMAMIRAAYAEIFPDLDRIVSFDCDTICVDDVDYLWEHDVSENWVSCTREDLGAYNPYGPTYYNVGVCIYNLAQMRKDNATEQLVDYINSTKLWCVEQDAFNYFMRITPLDARYNESAVTAYTDNPAIVHYASFTTQWRDNIKAPRREYARKYEQMTWKEAMELHHG